MKRHGEVQINSFFVEIILVILFFSVSVAVTLQLFVAAGNHSQQSTDLTMAVIHAQDTVELVKSADSKQGTEELLLAEAHQSNGVWIYSYDKEWKPSSDDARYFVLVTVDQELFPGGTLLKTNVLVKKEKDGISKELYKLNTEKYVAGGST